MLELIYKIMPLMLFLVIVTSITGTIASKNKLNKAILGASSVSFILFLIFGVKIYSDNGMTEQHPLLYPMGISLIIGLLLLSLAVFIWSFAKKTNRED